MIKQILIFASLLLLILTFVKSSTASSEFYFSGSLPVGFSPCAPASCPTLPSFSAGCANGISPGTGTNCGLPACSGGDSWTRYNIYSSSTCYSSGFFCMWGFKLSAGSCNIGDKCGANGPVAPYLQAGDTCTSCNPSSSTFYNYKTCCSGSSLGDVCTQYDAESPPQGYQEGYCPATGQEVMCGVSLATCEDLCGSTGAVWINSTTCRDSDYYQGSGATRYCTTAPCGTNSCEAILPPVTSTPTPTTGPTATPIPPLPPGTGYIGVKVFIDRNGDGKYKSSDGDGFFESSGNPNFSSSIATVRQSDGSSLLDITSSFDSKGFSLRTLIPDKWQFKIEPTGPWVRTKYSSTADSTSPAPTCTAGASCDYYSGGWTKSRQVADSDVEEFYLGINGPPPTPTALTYQQVCSGLTEQVNLSWNASTGATSYNIYRWNTPTTGIWNLLTTSNTNSKTIDLTQGAGYTLHVKAVNANGESSASNQLDFTAITCVPPPTSTPTPTPTPPPCQVTTSPSSLNLIIGGSAGTVTASVTSGLGSATISEMYFGSYNTSLATVNPTSDLNSPYQTAITAIASGTTAVWATAALSDGRICQSTSTSDTDINVSGPTSTPTPTPIPTYDISGTIYIDDNDDGVLNGTETGYTGSTISMSINGGAFGDQTLSSGSYTITGFLENTSNTLEITLPASYSLTNGGANPNTNPRTVAIVASNVSNINFGIALAPTYTISGNVYVDTNSNSIKDGGETNWTGAITIGSTGGSVSYPGSGQFTVSNVPAGTYTISYTSGPPAGYYISSPTNGPPPSYSVTVGPDKTDNNFGIEPYGPWIQTDGGNTRFDSGISNPIPSTATCTGGANFSTNSTGGGPGIVFGGGSSPNLGDGAPSVNGWVVWDTTNPPVYSPSKGVLSTSYDFVDARMKQAGTTVTTVSSISSSTPTGNYKVNGNLTISTDITIPGNVQIVVLINGNLIIQGDISILVATTSTLTFIVKEDITIDANVGSSISTSTTPSLEGYYSTDKSFIVQGGSVCPTADKKLNIAGSVVVNAARKGGSFVSNRSLCTDNSICPVVNVRFRPDFILNAPESIKRDSTVYQEVAP